MLGALRPPACPLNIASGFSARNGSSHRSRLRVFLSRNVNCGQLVEAPDGLLCLQCTAKEGLFASKPPLTQL
ncbi:hypothetical protein Nepgr_008882 [Nepenthes gracilis]|uniref:Uncharacterized protein n=1 Tax=Nepenthes gracilis TaxID=150966 RepID=A0AAD3S9S0_NEPGR|nr:hypothetical protein Nepgr_008882 [Nepenthes gracilis]